METISPVEALWSILRYWLIQEKWGWFVCSTFALLMEGESSSRQASTCWLEETISVQPNSAGSLAALSKPLTALYLAML